MNTQNRFTPLDVGSVNNHLTVKAPRTQKRGVKYVRAVRRGDDDDVMLRLEAVHLDEQRVQCLLAFVVAAVDIHPAPTPYRVYLVDKHNTRRTLFSVFEEVTNPRCAYTYKHLYKVRAGDTKKGYFRLACDSFGEVRFTRAWRSDHQHAVGNARAQRVKLAGVFEKLDHFEEVVFCLFDARDIFEERLRVLFGDHAGFGLAKLHRAVAAAAHPAHQIPQKADHEENRQKRNQNAAPVVAGGRDIDLDALLTETL